MCTYIVEKNPLFVHLFDKNTKNRKIFWRFTIYYRKHKRISFPNRKIKKNNINNIGQGKRLFSLYICVSSISCFFLLCHQQQIFIHSIRIVTDNIKVNGHYILEGANVHKYYNSGKQGNKFILKHEQSNACIYLCCIAMYSIYITKFKCR